MLRPILLVTAFMFAAGANAQRVERYAQMSIGERIGTLEVSTSGKNVSVDWNIDDNGRGPKIKEKIELGADGVPVKWDIEGKAWVGAPVKESFAFENGKATWKSLDDAGEASVKSALYLPNNGSPYALSVLLRSLLVAPGKKRALLPGGEVRLEKIRDIKIADLSGTVYALRGLDVLPTFIIAKGDRLVGKIDPGWVLVEEAHIKKFDALSKLAGDLSAELLAKLTRDVTHNYDAPVVIKNVRVFDAATGQLGAPTNVITFRGIISNVRNEAPPADAVVVDGEGGTLLPGLHDLHAHTWDWMGPLHIAAGVTSTRDPGNDNDVLLALEKRIESGELIGPRVQKAGFLEGRSPFSAKGGFVVDNVDDALARVRWYADHGYRQIKIYNSMNPDWVAAIAKEAHRLGLRVSGHVPAFMTSERAVRDGYDEINHINQLVLSWVIGPKDDTRTPFRFTALGERMGPLDLKKGDVQRMITLMKARGTTLDPTLAIFQQMLLSRPGETTPPDKPWLDHMPVTVQRARRSAWLDVKPDQYPLYEASYKKLQEVMLLLHKQGIRLVPGTDDMAGFMLHSELETWVHSGIPAPSVLQSATIGAAKYLGTDQQVGSIGTGKYADLMLVEGDPTTNISAIRNVRMVMKGGPRGTTLYFPDEIYSAMGIKPFAKRANVTNPTSPSPVATK